MAKRILRTVLLCGGIVLVQHETCWALAQSHETERRTMPPTTGARVAATTQTLNQQCFPGSEAGISCEGIAAKAAVAQVKISDAQAELGRWQMRMGVGTLAAAIIAALFAWLAIRETRKIGESQVRAYLTIDKIQWKSETYGASFRAFIRNSGNSPALSSQIISKVIHPDGSTTTIEPFEEHNVPAQSTIEFAQCFFRGEIDKSKSTLVSVAVGYADVFGNVWKIQDRFVGLNATLTDQFETMMAGRDVASYIRSAEVNGIDIDK